MTAARITRTLLTVAVLMAPLPGCGGDDDPGSARTDPDRTEGASPRASVQSYGSKADADTQAAVARSVQDFFAARAAGDGAEGCALLSEALRKQLIQTLGQSPQAKGRGCSALLARLFNGQPSQYRARIRQVEVTGVRVKDDRGLALLEVKAIPEDVIPVRREDGTWKVAAVAGSEIP